MRRRRDPDESGLRRGPAFRDTLPTLQVFCEGTKTEPGWLRHLRQRFRAVNLLEWQKDTHQGTAPLSVLKAAKEHAQRGAEVWVSFDRDEHDLRTALIEAKQAGFGIVFSNPCFELWPALHFERSSGGKIHRHDMEHELKGLLPGYDHDKGASVPWPQLEKSTPHAITQALRLHRQSSDATTWIGEAGPSAAMTRPTGALQNPSTTAWLLHTRCAEPALFSGPGLAPRDHRLVRYFVENPALTCLIDCLPSGLQDRFRRSVQAAQAPAG